VCPCGGGDGDNNNNNNNNNNNSANYSKEYCVLQTCVLLVGFKVIYLTTNHDKFQAK
jgi:hypothetical protein